MGAHSYIVPDSTAKKCYVLGYIADTVSQVSRIYLSDICTIHAHHTANGLIQTKNKLAQSRFAGAYGTNDTDLFCGFYLEGDIIQDLYSLVRIGKITFFEFNGSFYL